MRVRRPFNIGRFTQVRGFNGHKHDRYDLKWAIHSYLRPCRSYEIDVVNDESDYGDRKAVQRSQEHAPVAPGSRSKSD